MSVCLSVFSLQPSKKKQPQFTVIEDKKKMFTY